MTGEEMERAIDFLLRSQATLEGRIEQVNTNLGARIEELTNRVGELTGSVTELNRVVQMQSTSQAELNQMLTRAVTGLAEAQAKTEAKVDRLTELVERLAEG